MTLSPLTQSLLISTEAFAEPEICYVLDGILFLYGIILTVLYCRIKVGRFLLLRKIKKAKKDNTHLSNP